MTELDRLFADFVQSVDVLRQRLDSLEDALNTLRSEFDDLQKRVSYMDCKLSDL